MKEKEKLLFRPNKIQFSKEAKEKKTQSVKQNK